MIDRISQIVIDADKRAGYRTEPEPIETMPPGIPYIVGNEAAERFSYYGMRTILFPFMTKFLIDSSGALDVMSEHEANAWSHTFFSAVYFIPLLGGMLADTLIGKYRTIVILSLVYCCGHLALALDDTRMGLLIGLALIALGAGGIKPCVSAHVGDQFSRENQHLLPKVYGWFYFSINFGSFFSTLLTPAILNRQGRFEQWIPADVRTPSLAFALPGVLMFLATLVFWLGRRKYAHIPPRGKQFLRDLLSREGLGVLLRLGALYLFVAFFWCLYDQTATSWVAQAERMDRNSPVLAMALKIVSLGFVAPREEIAAEQVQAINPLLIMLLIPIFNYVIYPVVNRFVTLTPLRRIGIGFVLTVLSFLLVWRIEGWLSAGLTVSIWWQLAAFVIITAGEVMVSITVLEYSYTQAPPSMKSFVMSLNMLSVSLGNMIAATVNGVISSGTVAEALKGPNYFLFFAALLTVVTVGYIFASQRFPEHTYVQGVD